MSEEAVEVTEAQVAVHWREEKPIPPPRRFVDQAYLNDPGFASRFREENFPECFRIYADLLTWDRAWHTTLDTSHPPFWRWFAGGKLNACANCVDRHLGKHGKKAAFLWVPEPESEQVQTVTYEELHRRVNEFACLLRDFCGLKAGDRVTFHLPMVPELPVSMLACARLGIIHSEVFGGFSAKACADRSVDAQSRVLVTIDGYYRNGELLDHKAKADETVEEARKQGEPIDKVLIWSRYPGRYVSKSPPVQGRDYLVHELLRDYRGKRVEPVSMNAEAPLFLMYTSGTTGRPKGCQHSTGGYLSYVAGTCKYMHDIHPEDVHWCFADIGWITGHSYIVYGPLAIAATSVMYEGVPTHPDAGRPWRIAERLGVTLFHTAPTTIRMLRKAGPDEPKKYNYHFKLMVTVGEPIEPEVWRWYYDVVGKGEAVILDTWWQTENGGWLCAHKAALEPMKAGSCGPGALGIYPVIYGEDGKEIRAGEGRAGNICIKNPWPGQFQTVWRQPDRFVETYFKKYCKNPNSKDWRDWPYLAGDAAVQAADGYYRILGRVDDVINVAGHRLGTKEIESAALTAEEVAEAAVVPVLDELKGKAVGLYCSLKPGHSPSRALEEKISGCVVKHIGPIARPKHLYIVPDMPKTRSGKIMRRVLAAISNRADYGDISTLANPDIVETIRKMVQGEGAKPRKKEIPKEIAQFGAEP